MMHVPRECLRNRSLRQRVEKDFASGTSHLAKLRFAIGIKHARIIKTLVARFLAAPNLQSSPEVRASVLRRNDRRLQRKPVSSAAAPTRPEPPASPAGQTDRARR